MRWVADEGVDAPIVSRLRERNHIVWYVAEMMAGIADEEVLALAQEQDAILKAWYLSSYGQRSVLSLPKDWP